MKFNTKLFSLKFPLKSWIYYAEIILIVATPLFPLFFNLPYRDNIYLSWEGAYRLYLGQIPYVDFGLPLGFGFWLIPALFFKVFGPSLFTLIKAQVFINILSLIAFRNILKLLGATEAKRLLGVLLFILSYSFPNFWPWYNHTVFVFQLISFNLILYALYANGNRNFIYIILAGLFSFLSFYTKQDSGAISIIFGGAILFYHNIVQKQYRLFLIYFVSIILFSSIFILPFLKYDFLYWFNYGQFPHNSRLELYDFINNIFKDSQWEKFYILLITIVVLSNYKFKNLFIEDRKYIFLFITVGIILQALVVKLTSPLPTDHASYFHAFAFAFLISNVNLSFKLERIKNIFIICLLLFGWWSSIFWGYAERIFKITPSSTTKAFVNTDTDASQNPGLIQTGWKTTSLKVFKHIRMPTETIEGINNILELDIMKSKRELKVLNMSELTPLAYEMGYEPQKNQPLWYHLNIGMFQREVEAFNKKVENEEYDLILFQVIPDLDNFFPYAVQEEVRKKYKLIDTFEAPRKRTEGYSYIEVYIRKN